MNIEHYYVLKEINLKTTMIVSNSETVIINIWDNGEIQVFGELCIW